MEAESIMEAAHLSIEQYRKKQKLTNVLESTETVEKVQAITSSEEESNFNSALSTLFAENSWKMVSTKGGKYKVEFKSSLSYKEKINILEIVLEDIRERYLDLRMEYQRMKRKCNHKKKKRKRGS